jgi:hypothetical protein
MLADRTNEERNDPMSNELAVASSRSLSKPQQSNVDIFKVTSLAEAFELAKGLAESGMVPKAYIGKPFAIMATWQFAAELGVGLMQGLQGISNINGTPSVWGDLGWAIVTNHPEFEDADEDLQDTFAVCTLRRKGRTDVTRKYTLDMAKTASLLGKDNWKNHPRRMLQWRARSWAMRDLFPDALKGLAIAEEALDFDAPPPPQPKPQGQITVPKSGQTLAEVVLANKAAPTEEASAAVIEDKPAEAQPETVQQEDIAPTDDPEMVKALAEEARQWATGYYQAYKAAGKTPDESKAFLKKNFDIEDSRQVPSAKREFAMEQAKVGFPVMKE